MFIPESRVSLWYVIICSITQYALHSLNLMTTYTPVVEIECRY